jgi:peptidoglycan/xylan/chitin deacetylase (PgdA/CDA1 family)
LKPVVVGYHAIHDPEPGVHAEDVIATPEALERNVRDLLDGGYRILAVDELLEQHGAAQPTPGTAVLTFDDGWLDGLTVAAPLLESLGVRGTFFVCPGLWGNHDLRMGEAGRVLTEEQARALAATGMDLGAHSLTHPDLRTLDDAALRVELVESKAAVEALTVRPCRSFAYPSGWHDARVRRAVASAGFDVAFGFSSGPWHPLAVPRSPGPL